jgi:hypothetical protein
VGSVRDGELNTCKRRIGAFIQSHAPAEKRLASQRATLAAVQGAKQETVAQL